MESSTLVGYIGAAAMIILIVLRQMRGDVRIEFAHIGIVVGTYMAASTLPSALVLCHCGLMPDPRLSSTVLHGYERCIGLGGVSMFLSVSMSLWGLVKNVMGR